MIIEPGRIYRAKKKKRDYYYDDRQVLWVGDRGIQYDSPKVRDGRAYPTISREKFEAWCGSDVTEGYPEGDWMRQ